MFKIIFSILISLSIVNAEMLQNVIRTKSGLELKSSTVSLNYKKPGSMFAPVGVNLKLGMLVKFRDYKTKKEKLELAYFIVKRNTNDYKLVQCDIKFRKPIDNAFKSKYKGFLYLVDNKSLDNIYKTLRTIGNKDIEACWQHNIHRLVTYGALIIER